MLKYWRDGLCCGSKLLTYLALVFPAGNACSGWASYWDFQMVLNKCLVCFVNDPGNGEQWLLQDARLCWFDVLCPTWPLGGRDRRRHRDGWMWVLTGKKWLLMPPFRDATKKQRTSLLRHHRQAWVILKYPIPPPCVSQVLMLHSGRLPPAVALCSAVSTKHKAFSVFVTYLYD